MTNRVAMNKLALCLCDFLLAICVLDMYVQLRVFSCSTSRSFVNNYSYLVSLVHFTFTWKARLRIDRDLL